jgi:alpha-L-rhamnosidase
LEEYLARSGDRQMVDALQPRIMKLFDWFRRYQNSDGLLEKLPGWIFIEWSPANDFVQDVNYPTNMEYVGALAAAGRMYHDDALLRQAQKTRDTIVAQSGHGEFFVDNAVRKDGRLELTKNTTEVCQYMAFYFGLVSLETRPELWKKLCEQFGPERDAAKVYPNVHKANAIIGNYVRMELLSRYGLQSKMLSEARNYYLKMAETTGTLWEHDTTAASCDHGFASHAAHMLYRDALGILAVDVPGRSVSLRFADIPLESCEGEIPVPDGRIKLQWRKEPHKLLYHVDVPSGYRVHIDNRSGRQLVESQP